MIEKSEESFDLLIGPHAISCALKNPQRQLVELHAIAEGVKDLQQKMSVDEWSESTSKRVKIHDKKKFQAASVSLYAKYDWPFKRVPGGVVAVFRSLPFVSLRTVLEEVRGGDIILALDGVTDVQNSGAILRTCAFYNVKALVIPQKGSFRTGPQFFRLASGASEFVPVVRVSSLPKALRKIKEHIGEQIIGLSEEGDKTLEQTVKSFDGEKGVCLVMGAEGEGLSHATTRSVDNLVILKGDGPLETLNVSVATAVTLEKVTTTLKKP